MCPAPGRLRRPGARPADRPHAGRDVRPHGPVHAARRGRAARDHRAAARRRKGLYALAPVLARGTVRRRAEPVTQIEKDVSPTATVAGINGDLFTSPTRTRPGRDVRRVLVHRRSGRSSIGVDSAGALHVDRVKFFGTWKGTGQRRPLAGLNETPAPGQVVLFTPAYGGRSRASPARPRWCCSRSPRRCRTPISRRGHRRWCRRRRVDPAGRRRADGGRIGGAQAAGRGAGRHADDAAPDPAAGVDRRRVGTRRRAAARTGRQGGLPLARGLHERAGRRARARVRASASSPTAASSSSPSTGASRATASG